MQPIVSVIIPTYNRSDLVCRAIQSALAQDYDSFEIIVVDDASTDDTESKIQDFADTRITYMRLPRNLGAGAARNHGINVAKGAFVAFLDSDDIWLPQKLTSQLKAVTTAQDQQRVFCYSRFFFNRGSTCKERPLRGINRGEDAAEYLFCEAGTIHTSSILVSRSLCKDIMFPSVVGEDTEFTIDMYLAGAEFIYVEQTLSFYHSDCRPDRFSLNGIAAELFALAKRLQSKVSTRALLGFYATTIAPHLIMEKKPSCYLSAGWMIGKAICRGALSPTAALNVLAIFLLPSRLHIVAQQVKAGFYMTARHA